MNFIIWFVKNNIAITITTVLCLTCTVLAIIFIDYVGLRIQLLIAIPIGWIVSIIFYLVNNAYPQWITYKKMNKYVTRELYRLSKWLKSTYEQHPSYSINMDSENDFKPLLKEGWNVFSKEVDINMSTPKNIKYYYVYEHILNCCEMQNRIISSFYRFPVTCIPVELKLIFEKIYSSSLHTTITWMMRKNIEFYKSDDCPNFYHEIFKIQQELNEYINKQT